MLITVLPCTRDLIPAVKDFNLRLAGKGCPGEYLFPERELSPWLPKLNGRTPYEELYAAVDGSFVRGAYILKHQEFSIWGRILSLGYYHSPISEGIVDRKYSTLGIHLLMDALAKQPLIFALGMGSREEPLPRLLAALRWTFRAVPFYFKPLHAASFLRNIEALRKTRARRLALDLLASSGLGALGLKALNGFARRRRVRVEQAGEFGSWADELWEHGRSRYALCAVRDRKALNILYPPGDERFVRLRVFTGGRAAGWAVVVNTAMRSNKYFGNMRVGSIVDGFALPDDAGAVIAGAARYLEDAGADLVVSNQAHAAWGAALRHAGFREGPSNFLFASSPKLTELLSPFEANATHFHLLRGDGDGPIHL